MVGLLADQGVGSIPWSPLNGGINARPWGDRSTVWSQSNAADRGVPMAQVALAWVLRNPVVDSVLSGATKQHHLADAAAALDITLTDDEVQALEGPYVPRKPTYFQ